MNSKIIKTKLLIILVIFITAVITCINPIYPEEQILQHLGTLVLIIVLIVDLKRTNVSVFAFAFFAVYIIVHIIGARYIYSYVPYNKWMGPVIEVFSKTPGLIQEGRNGFDRFVHFAFGILLFPFIYEAVGSGKKIEKKILILLVWTLMQSISMLYELFEWGLTYALSPEAANDYNGQQGDMWDAQKDMFLAMIGSSLIALGYVIVKKRKRPGADTPDL